MPDNDFELGDAAGVLNDRLKDRPTALGRSPAGVQPAGFERPTALQIIRHGRNVTIRFMGREIVDDDYCLAAHRDQIIQLIDDPNCDVVTFDLTGVKILLSSMLGLLVSARNRGREVELLNPSPELQRILRTTKLDTLLLIRGSTP